MTKVIKNSLLILVLTFLFGLPYSGFGFIGKRNDGNTKVLGVQSFSHSVCREKNKTEVIDQLDLDLTLNKGAIHQKFYNVIPEKYISDDYQTIVVLPSRYKELGVKAKLSKNDLTMDLLVDLSESANDVGEVEAIILVLK